MVGFVHSQLADTYGHRLRAFRQGLADTGYIEGRNVDAGQGGDAKMAECAARVRDLLTQIVGRACCFTG